MESRSKGAAGSCSWSRSALVAPPAATAAFPGSDPAESPRLNTPNDPDFDRCEADDAETPAARLLHLLRGGVPAFGFSPDSANLVPLAPATRTRRRRPATSTAPSSTPRARPRTSPPASTREACCRRSPASAPTPPGSTRPATPTRSVAILDTGIRWQDRELRRQGPPERATSCRLPAARPRRRLRHCAADDCNGDGAFNVRDFADDPRVDDRRRRQRVRRDPRRLRPDRDLLRRHRRRLATATSTTSPAGTSSTTTTTPSTPRAAARPTATAPGRATRGRRRRPTTAHGGVGHVPRLPDHAAAGLGHLRRARPTTSRWASSTRPTTAPASSRARSAASPTPSSRAAPSSYADEQGRRADAGLLRHQQRQPQLPDQLQRGDLRRRVALRHRARTTPAPGPGGLPGVGDLPIPRRPPEFEDGCDAAARPARRRPRDQPGTSASRRPPASSATRT